MMTVKEILAGKGTQVWTISADANVFDALQTMSEANIGALIVLDGDRIAGIMSERDYARKGILQNRLSQDTPVRDIMTSQIYGVSPETTAEECMALMTDKRIRHLPVLESEKLAGVVSIGDIVKSIISEQQVTIEHLQNYIMGKYR